MPPLAMLGPREALEDDPEPEVMIPANASALEYLRAIYRDPRQPEHRRTRAAIAALPFEHPQLAVVASMTAGPGFAAALEATIARSGVGLKLIDAQPADGRVTNPEGAGDIR
jgi:hypothetical protein